MGITPLGSLLLCFPTLLGREPFLSSVPWERLLLKLVTVIFCLSASKLGRLCSLSNYPLSRWRLQLDPPLAASSLCKANWGPCSLLLLLRSLFSLGNTLAMASALNAALQTTSAAVPLAIAHSGTCLGAPPAQSHSADKADFILHWPRVSLTAKCFSSPYSLSKSSGAFVGQPKYLILSQSVNYYILCLSYLIITIHGRHMPMQMCCCNPALSAQCRVGKQQAHILPPDGLIRSALKHIPLLEHCFLKSSLPEIKSWFLRKEKETSDSTGAGCTISQEFVSGTRWTVWDRRLKIQNVYHMWLPEYYCLFHHLLFSTPPRHFPTEI